MEDAPKKIDTKLVKEVTDNLLIKKKLQDMVNKYKKAPEKVSEEEREEFMLLFQQYQKRKTELDNTKVEVPWKILDKKGEE